MPKGTNIKVGLDVPKKLLVVEFEEPIRWIAMSYEEASKFIDVLIGKLYTASELEKGDG